jgi:hypothetical protein
MNVSAAAKSEHTVQTARYVSISVRQKRATSVTGWRRGSMVTCERLRAREQGSIIHSIIQRNVGPIVISFGSARNKP